MIEVLNILVNKLKLSFLFYHMKIYYITLKSNSILIQELFDPRYWFHIKHREALKQTIDQL